MAGQFTSPGGLNGHSPYSTDEYFIRSDSIKSAELDDTGECSAFRANHIKTVIFSLWVFFILRVFWMEQFACYPELALYMRGGFVTAANEVMLLVQFVCSSTGMRTGFFFSFLALEEVCALRVPF